MVDSNILFAWGASSKKIEKGEFIFHDGDEPRYYYQIEEGQVKMFNINDDGKEFTQGIFFDGESFGEPPLFINEKYPAYAKAIKDSIILKLPKDRFIQILEEYRYIEKDFIKMLARRTYNKAITAKAIINNSPEHRLLSFLHYYKKNTKGDMNAPLLIPFTRQEIADQTGLRVETVIRTLKALAEMKKVQIIDRKLYL